MTIHILTLVQSVAESPTLAALEVEAALLKERGTRVMTPLYGDCVVIGSKQIPSGCWDILLTSFQSLTTYHAAVASAGYREAVGSAAGVRAFSFQRTSVTDILIPILFPIKWLLMKLTCSLPDIETRADNAEHLNSFIMPDGSAVGPDEYEVHLETDTLADPHEPAYMVNLMQKVSTPEGVRAGQRYSASVFNIFSAFGCRPLHIGPVVSIPLAGCSEQPEPDLKKALIEPSDHPRAEAMAEREPSFDTVAIVRYPSREFALKLSRSQVFQNMLADKDASLSDTLVQCSLPFRPTTISKM